MNKNREPNNLKFYLHYAIYMETHDKLWYIAHQIVQPVINTSENVNWFVVIPKSREKKNIKFKIKAHNGNF